MERYALFAGSFYYPSGGWNDFKGTYHTVQEAVDYIEAYANSDEEYDWYHVIDLATGKDAK